MSLKMVEDRRFKRTSRIPSFHRHENGSWRIAAPENFLVAQGSCTVPVQSVNMSIVSPQLYMFNNPDTTHRMTAYPRVQRSKIID